MFKTATEGRRRQILRLFCGSPCGAEITPHPALTAARGAQNRAFSARKSYSVLTPDPGQNATKVGQRALECDHASNIINQAKAGWMPSQAHSPMTSLGEPEPAECGSGAAPRVRGLSVWLMTPTLAIANRKRGTKMPIRISRVAEYLRCFTLAVRGLRPWQRAGALKLCSAPAFAALLSACGGGGSGTSGGGTDVIVPSASVAGRCVSPRPAGTLDGNGVPYADKVGSLDDEQSWVRGWIDETYLWYADVRALPTTTLDRRQYSTAVSYFDVLKSPAITASGKEKDAYHFVYDTATWLAMSNSGVSYGYGFEVSLISSSPPRKAVVSYTVPGTPADLAGVQRGAQVLTVDGVDLVNDSSNSGIAVLNAGLFPEASGSHTFQILDQGSTTARTVTLSAAPLQMPSVQNVKALPAPYQTVGYLQFNQHVAPAETELVDAINQLLAAQVTDVVLDMRYNGGGYLDIASELAFMIAGPSATAGKVFEQLNFNDKNPFQLSTSQRTTPFFSAAQGFSVTAGQSLPYLGLNRVYVLAGSDTCSASESVVNGLRGIGVDVVLVGGATCGKPYGFYATDNCSTTYFSIQFQGVNQLGFGNYADGFAPNCAVPDDFSHSLGDANEALLAAALTLRAGGSCPVVPSKTLVHALSAAPQRQAANGVDALALRRPALWNNRFYRGEPLSSR